ncbi:MAG: ribonuclease J [Eubacteriales bacterium]|nr:ribonuclease J [Clostridium sp.]MCI7012627.1 ribonuclease J [Clostridium sp.]MDY2926742.1 ribonuclease J [Eubacteriales bacterium]MDY5000912.1 ribonuclease J [Eubacteriales bacterium]MDY5798801.1 ribonuclease J [Eubacteriales bacterium]
MAKKTAPKLRIIPLGGLGEIGKNMTVFEYGDDIIVVDCGLAFPDEDMLGIDIVIPDMSYLELCSEKLRAFIITHGHEDHIGAIPYAMDKFQVPVYGTKFTLALVDHKLHEKGINNADLRCIAAGDVIEIGCFRIEFIKVSHSIAGAVALAITTPVGVIIHTGDFKVDYTPIDNEPIDMGSFARYGTKGVLALMMDSTNAESAGITPSEAELGKTFEQVFNEAEGRIIVASFASNVYRIQQVVDIAAAHGRVVCFQGRSMVMIGKIAQELGYLHIPEGCEVPLEKLKNYENNRVCILTTGSQGESMSGLFRMANANHKVIIGKGDTVVISASAIPGNEKSVGRVINQLFQRGANVVYDRLADVHVSGHARQEELKLMLLTIKPKYFIPVHGEARHLHHHAKLAERMGIPESNIFIMENGRVLELTRRSAKLNGSVTSGAVMVDGLGVGDIGTAVLQERRLLSQDGLVAIVIPVQRSTGELLGVPELITKGFIYVKDSTELFAEAKEFAYELAVNLNRRNKTDWNSFKNGIKNGMRNFLLTKTRRTPIILPVILEVDC